MFKILDTNETKGHLVEQPGLRGHSHDPESDLMKQFVISESLETGGNLWVASFHTVEGAFAYLAKKDYEKSFKILDQFDNNAVVFQH